MFCTYSVDMHGTTQITNKKKKNLHQLDAKQYFV
jgi:hypothetical protein